MLRDLLTTGIMLLMKLHKLNKLNLYFTSVFCFLLIFPVCVKFPIDYILQNVPSAHFKLH